MCVLLQAADYDEDTVMEYTPPEETNRRQRQREIEAEREREQKVLQSHPSPASSLHTESLDQFPLLSLNSCMCSKLLYPLGVLHPLSPEMGTA